MICPVCGNENPEDAVKCWGCGIQFAVLLENDNKEVKTKESIYY